MRTVAIIQARTGSTRLPGKVLLPLAGRPMLHQIVERVRRATRVATVVVACPWQDVEALTPAVSGCALVADRRVPDADLVLRYLRVAQQVGAEVIVRVCADNPCIEPEYIDRAVERYFAAPVPCVSNTTDRVGAWWVDGIGAEVFSLSRLMWLEQVTRDGDPCLREHVHRRFEVALPLADVRLDVNTPADYTFLADIYARFGSNRFHVREVLDYLGVESAR